MDNCWFCNKEIKPDEVGYISREWDCVYHKDCFESALAEGNNEAKIIYENEWL